MGPDGVMVADIRPVRPAAECEANAVLIAAAPELLHELQSLYELCCQGEFRNGVTDGSGTRDEGDTIAGRRMDRARVLILRLGGAT
jgi:hypothetical protein